MQRRVELVMSNFEGSRPIYVEPDFLEGSFALILSDRHPRRVRGEGASYRTKRGQLLDRSRLAPGIIEVAALKLADSIQPERCKRDPGGNGHRGVRELVPDPGRCLIEP
jgi:hypothetical protein